MKKVLNISFYMMFVLYMLLVLYTVLLNRMGMPMRNLREVNLIPFQSIIEFTSSGNTGAARLNIWGNVLMFIPMGIYFRSFFQKDSLLKGIAKLGLISLAIEISQFVLNAGGTDIDDIILNVTGGLIGMLITSLLFKFLKHTEKVRVAVVTLSLLFGVPVVGLLVLVYRIFI